MSDSITPEADQLQVPLEPPPHWSENAVCIFNAPDSGLAVYTHFSRIDPDPRLWEGVMAVYLPGGELLVSRSFSASESGTVIDAGALRYTCVEPLEQWRLEFDGLMRRTTTAELAAGFLRDGPVEPVRAAFDLKGVRPVWNLGHVPDQSWGDFHLEQECQIDGAITMGREETAVSTLGLRDHSRGVREHEALLREGWSFGFFPSGRSFVALHITNAGGPDLVTGYFFDGETQHPLTSVEVPDLLDATGAPRDYQVTFGGEFGEFTVTGTLEHAVPFALARATGQTIGFDGDFGAASLMVEGPATPVLDGETGHGWLERVTQQ